MRKFIAILLCLMLVLSLAACGENKIAAAGTISENPTPAADTAAAEASTAAETQQPAETEETAPAEAAPAETQPEPAVEETPAEEPAEPFTFTYNGVTMTPGEDYNGTKLGEPDSIEVTPDCRTNRDVTHYCFPDVTIATVKEESGREYITGITLETPMVTTAEGIGLGRDRAQVIAAYGENYQDVLGSMVYTRGGTSLTISCNEAEQVIYVVYSIAD